MKPKHYIERNEYGDLVIPKGILETLEIKNHQEFMITSESGNLVIKPSIHSLKKLYVEVTSDCNLNCVTCIRHHWNEACGQMDPLVFKQLVKQVKAIETIESIMFGGFGEPLSHPDILEMIQDFHQLGLKTSVTTNGTLLTENMIQGLIKSGLNELWVSMDGFAPDQFNKIREGGDFVDVYESLKLFKRINNQQKSKVTLGLAFVLTKDNVDELSKIRHFASTVWAEKISISNVIPYERKMEDKMLCKKKLHSAWTHLQDKNDLFGFREIVVPEISLPKIDYTSLTKEPLYDIYQSMMKIKMLDESYRSYKDYCRFIHDGNSFIRWDGKVAPCMGLIHDHETYLNGQQRQIKGHVLGDITTESLAKIWESHDYRDFREKVYDFEFSPCVHCGGCEEVDTNDKDCLTDTFPSCGGCLWPQGIIQCP